MTIRRRKWQRALISWFVIVSAGMMPLLSVRGDDSLPLETLERIKAATVYVRVVAGEDEGSGSGFVFQVDGRDALIATNHHVVTPPRYRSSRGGPSGPVRITVVFDSGTAKARHFRAEVIASDPDPIRDLAVLRVTGVDDLPKPIDVQPKLAVVETQPVYILGFPFGRMLAFGARDPAITVGKGTVASIRTNKEGREERIQIDGDLNPGNSGGPVVDADGRLVGVAVATVFLTRIGLVIPHTELTRMLKGRIESSTVQPQDLDRGVAKVRLSVLLVDPLNQFGMLWARYVPTRELQLPLAATASSRQPYPLPCGREVPLILHGSVAYTDLSIPIPNEEARELTYQLGYVTGAGSPQFTGTSTYRFNYYGRPAANGQRRRPADAQAVETGKELKGWGQPIDPDGDCSFQTDEKKEALTIQVPGTRHDLNEGQSDRNAPRALTDIAGDFNVQVRVIGSYQPNDHATALDVRCLQAAGLVVWKGPNDFVLFLYEARPNQEGKVGNGVSLYCYENKRLVRTLWGRFDATNADLKLDRAGDELRFRFAPGGGALEPRLEAEKVALGASVKVGVIAVNTTTTPLTARLERFRVYQKGKLVIGGTPEEIAAAEGRQPLFDLLCDLMTRTPVIIFAGCVLATLLVILIIYRRPRTRPAPKWAQPPSPTPPAPTQMPTAPVEPVPMPQPEPAPPLETGPPSTEGAS